MADCDPIRPQIPARATDIVLLPFAIVEPLLARVIRYPDESIDFEWGCQLRRLTPIPVEAHTDRDCQPRIRPQQRTRREALRRQLGLMTFEGLREQVMPFAEARGYLTDEDIFEEIS